MKSLHTLRLEYVEHCRVAGSSPPRLKVLRHNLGRFATWLEAHEQIVRPDQLTADKFCHWQKQFSMRTSRQTGLPLTARTITRVVSDIRSFCRRLVKTGYLPETWLDQLPPAPATRFKQMPAPKHAQVRQFIGRLPRAEPEDFLLRALAEFVYSSGVRISEALGLDIEDIDFEHQLARVRGKGSEERVVPFGRLACRAMRNYLNGIRPLFLRDPNERALWLNFKGQRMTYDVVRERWVRASRNIDVGMIIRLHGLRRACTTELARAGVEPWLLKVLLGHKDFHSLKHYIDLDLNDLKKVHAQCHPRDCAKEIVSNGDDSGWATAIFLAHAGRVHRGG